MADIFGIIRKLKGKKRLSTVELTGLGVEQVGKKVYLFYQSSNDDDKHLRIARSADGMEFELFKKLKDTYHKEKIPEKYRLLLPSREDFFDNGKIEIEGIVKLPSGKLIVYHNQDPWGGYQVGMALIGRAKIKWRSESPVWETSTAWKGRKIQYVGMAYLDGKILGYWLVDKKEFYVVVYPSFRLRTKEMAQSANVALEKSAYNPIISPKSSNSWEAFNTFNPAAVYAGGKVHILYRAQGFDYVSVVGYAVSTDGITIEERWETPIYAPKEDFEWARKEKREVSWDFMSGGGYGGIEDPRITQIGDRIYMLYVAFNGVTEPRVAMTSISVDDFLNRRWLWEKAVLISPPGVVDKGPAIFPEKIDGKYVIMHRIFPNILIDYMPDLNFDGETWLKGEYSIKVRPTMWDSRKIGAGAPPIKTKEGWLLIYYATCDQENASRYLVGAMLLDLKDPTKVLYRSKTPILVPSERYENEGFKAGIVYPCGAVVINDTLFVYYGGADSYVCVATANLEEFIKQLKYNEEPKLDPAKIYTIKQR